MCNISGVGDRLRLIRVTQHDASACGVLFNACFVKSLIHFTCVGVFFGIVE